MLGERSDQRGLWEADRLYLDHVGKDTFYGLLASLRGRLFRDADFAEFYCADNLQGIYRGLVCQPGGQPGDSHGRAPLGFQDGRGHWKPARRSCFRRNPLNCCLGSRAENPGNRRAICLLEP